MKNISNSKQMLLILLITILSIIVYGCIFPVLNFSPEKPEIPVTVVLLNVVAFYFISKGMGAAIPNLFPQWSLLKIACYILTVSVAGLITRYLLELGETSNTYNFTVLNITFYLLIVVGLATLEANRTIKNRNKSNDNGLE